MGFAYEMIGTLYSLGRIPKCKVSMLAHLKPKDRVLVAGVGHGTEAVEACRLGADVTAVDLSATMLKHMQKKLDKSGLEHPIQLINDNILNIGDDQGYDMVIANFFLNVFSEEMMLKIFNHLTSLVRPGGCMVIGDFTLPGEGGLPFRVFQNVYWYVAAIFYWLTADNAVHRVYDYPELLKSKGFEIAEIKYFRPLGIKSYWSILGRKKDK